VHAHDKNLIDFCIFPTATMGLTASHEVWIRSNDGRLDTTIDLGLLAEVIDKFS
jgi:hypothetical protein